MKRIAPIALALCLALPVHAQDDPPAGEGLFNFMERMLRDFMTEAEPQLRELERGLNAITPEMERLMERMRDATQYYPPEVLPNGDILIRRRQPGEDAPDPSPDASPDAAPDGEEPFEL
ncbi:AAA+ family ATPase [Roseibaca sp. Y0-43]|uniref:AAA+ family ATPase n=1 Tax=Roseibaca sp. Y0-43 TaxID=2816854 RepID=UPI001D0CB435|nr:AAA+ family ATPase [Roseibaca sp. Y0-43]MCC1480657.1 AAA+ family ATPase [Roseibaca sp. Y0-43]